MVTLNTKLGTGYWGLVTGDWGLGRWGSVGERFLPTPPTPPTPPTLPACPMPHARYTIIV
ncbi:hypothetical protein [Nostoc sp. CMAA1605]|uniref:hypothetical protein n=1 Tax=Nostoc sp. CMAA1605 TaxID=2055159 RepID=UPI001F2133C4|nr:hypothetical protein [Nostoc sp. CMAA1605]